jgi:hypothetical protein
VKAQEDYGEMSEHFGRQRDAAKQAKASEPCERFRRFGSSRELYVIGSLRTGR